jgi:putative transposase
MSIRKIPFLPGREYHVYNHGNAKDDLFSSSENYHYFLKKYKEYINPIADTFAYCLMPNHFHFALRIKEEEELLIQFGNNAGLRKRKLTPPEYQTPAGLVKDFDTPAELKQNNLSLRISQQFGHFFNAYSQAFNRMYQRKGKLFLENVNRNLIEEEDYFLFLIRYIHSNPVKHDFTTNMLDWEHSSIHAFISQQNTQLLRSEVIRRFGGIEAFMEAHGLRGINGFNLTG